MPEVIDGHIHAGFGESFGNGAADAKARASHESNFSVKVIHGADFQPTTRAFCSNRRWRLPPHKPLKRPKSSQMRTSRTLLSVNPVSSVSPKVRKNE